VSSYKPHPDDEWIEVTSFGHAEPVFMLGRSGGADEIAAARAKYLAGQITIEEYESVVGRWVSA
jgi:hypothetical protein